MMHGTGTHGFLSMNNHGIMAVLTLVLIILITIYLIQNERNQRREQA